MTLTERERAVLDLIRRDPLLGSAAIAAALGTTRAAVNVHLSNLGKKGAILGRGYLVAPERAVVVVGGANMDLKSRSTRTAVPGTSNPGTTVMSAGGVGRNVAENLARLGTPTHLVAAVGADALGDQVLAATSAAGVRTDRVRRSARSTGTYTAVLDADGELVVAVADMTATDELAPADLDRARDLLVAAGLVVLDGNLAPGTLGYALDLAATAGVPTVLEPVSVPKAAAIAPLLAPTRPLFALTPNRDELAALTGRPVGTEEEVAAAVAVLHERGAVHVWVRLGSSGSLLSGPDGVVRLAAEPAEVVDVTGAGDAMLAAFCHAVLAGGTPAEAAQRGHVAAALTVASPHTVRPDLTDHLLARSSR